MIVVCVGPVVDDAGFDLGRGAAGAAAAVGAALFAALMSRYFFIVGVKGATKLDGS